MYPEYAPLIIPIPLSKQRLSQRGFNQISILLKSITKRYPELATLVHYDSLLKHRDTQSQTQLTRKERLSNVRGAFSCVTGIPRGSDILLIDDVLTTGATVTEASKVLYKCGAKRVTVLTLARAV
jgi:ComF family protein